MKKLNNSGFSMVQLMMAAGMMGLLSVGVMKIMENQRKSAKSIQSSAHAQSFFMEARTYMARPGYCKKNFEGLQIAKGDEFEIEEVLKSNGKVLYKKGQTFGGALKLSSISMSKFEKETDTTALMNLNFSLDKIGNSYGAKGFKKILKLEVYLNEKSEILDCGSFGLVHGMMNGSESQEGLHDGVKDLQKGIDSDNSKKVKSIMKKSNALKQLNNTINSINETNKQMEEMFKD
ncbi:hypothetical protein [Halobacteriovorax marinus]|uniref:hypothetical protein n=1 Tax=Halobacteriovorax marinus TaxID=97084 RepID=UPI003A90056D